MAKFIPEQGETFTGYVPANMKVAHLTVGSATTNDIVVGETGAYTAYTVSQPVAVFGVWTRIETAFTASVELDLGDTTSAESLANDTTIVPGTTGAVLVAATTLAVPIVYDAAQDILVTVAGATVAAGLAHVYIQYATLND